MEPGDGASCRSEHRRKLLVAAAVGFGALLQTLLVRLRPVRYQVPLDWPAVGDGGGPFERHQRTVVLVDEVVLADDAQAGRLGIGFRV